MFGVLFIIVLIILISFSETATNILAGSLAIGVFLAFVAACVGFMWLVLVMYFN